MRQCAIVSALTFTLFISLSNCTAISLRFLVEDTSKINFKAIEAYRRGETCLKERREADALEQFKMAVELDPDFADAYAKLSELYMEEYTLMGRIKAEEHIRQALKLSCSNAHYYLIYGLLKLKQGFRNIAKTKFEKAIELNPDYAEAYFNLGVICENEFMDFKNKIAGPVHFRFFAEEDKKKSIEYFKKTLELDPNHRDAFLHLGFVFLEIGRADMAIDMFCRVLENNREDKEAHLFLGLAFHTIGNEEKSFFQFNEAFALMEPEERTAYESIHTVSSEKDTSLLAYLLPSEKNAFVNGFWNSKDPLYLTDENERILEHYCRMAYANLRFGAPHREFEGWQSDRGKVFIRYGRPMSRIRVGASIGGADESILPNPSSIGPGESNPHLQRELSDQLITVHGEFLPEREHWSYNIDGKPIQFVFVGPLMKFHFSVDTNDSRWQYNTISSKVPESYSYDYGGKLFAFPCDFADFRGENGSSRLEIYYGLPTQKFSDTAAVQCGVFVFDDQWQEVARLTEDKDICIPKNREGDLIVDMEKFTLSPGEYHIIIEIRDKETKNTGRYSQEIAVESYGEDGLTVSDVQMAESISPSFEEARFTKNGLRVVPYPTKQYKKAQLVNIYYEMYNLSRDVYGETHFRMDFTVASVSGEKNVISHIISKMGNFVGIERKIGKVTVSYENKGQSGTEIGYSGIDVTSLLPGTYTLTLMVTDLNEKKNSSKSVEFNIIE